jgi:hypothetical protein
MTKAKSTKPEPPRKPLHPVWRILKIIVGIGFLGLGFIGLFLPVLQGVLFMLVGLAILSTESPRIRRLRDEIKRRHPGPWQQAHTLKERMKARFGMTERHKETTGDEGASGSAP